MLKSPSSSESTHLLFDNSKSKNAVIIAGSDNEETQKLCLDIRKIYQAYYLTNPNYGKVVKALGIIEEEKSIVGGIIMDESGASLMQGLIKINFRTVPLVICIDNLKVDPKYKGKVLNTKVGELKEMLSFFRNN
jgi:hypothetical protein